MKLALGCLAVAAGCGPKSVAGPAGSSASSLTGDTVTAGTTDATTAGETSGSTLSGTGDPGTSGVTDSAGASSSGSAGTSDGSGGSGECVVHEDCASGYCLSFQDAEPDPAALCERPPAAGATRFTGRVLNLETLTPASGVTVGFVSALEAATNPTGALSLLTTETDGSGRFDGTSDGPLDASIGIVARVADSMSLTPVASPIVGNEYGPGNDIHDLWTVAPETLEAWSLALAPDPEFAPYLPLGEGGGMIFIVRDQSTGMPVSGAVVTSTQPGSSVAVVRYLDGAGFVADSTKASGIGVIQAVLLAETFEVESTGVTFVGGSSPGAIFVASANVP